MTSHEGGCLCGDTRYKTVTEPVRLTICHCSFCQRMTGSAYLVEPIFRKGDVEFSGKPLRRYDHVSSTSGKRVTVNFCGRCGTAVYLDLERFPDIVGMCGGTFDDRSWFNRIAVHRHIYTNSAQAGVILPADIDLFEEHATELDGTPNEPLVLAHAVTVTEK